MPCFNMRGDMWTDVVFLTNFLLYIYFIFLTAHFDMFWVVYVSGGKRTQIQMKNKFMGCAWKLVSIQKWFYAFFNDSHNYFLCFFYRVLSRYVLFIFCIFFMNMWRFFVNDYLDNFDEYKFSTYGSSSLFVVSS